VTALLLAAPARAQEGRDSARVCGPDAPAAACRTPASALPRRAAGTDALVLSGGGSRGLAHPGALLALEERGFDADIVTGTSIGALVGALYAAGYPAAEIQRQVRSVDWSELFTPAPVVYGPDRAVRYPLLVLDRQADSLRFNRGIVPQWRMNRALVRLLFDAEARARGDFDRLARRFRTVATDLRTGAPVVLDSGDLARAVRASIAVPGVFAPVEWNGRTLIDGGISDNLPLDAARRIGGRFTVAIDVGRPTPEIVARDPFSVIGRSLDLLQDNAQRDSVPPDVWIVPPLPPTFGGVTFPNDPGNLFAIGYRAVVSAGDSIRFTGREPRGLPAPPSRFAEVRIEAPDSAHAALARHRFQPLAGEPYSVERVLRAVDRLYTTGLFEGVWPRVEGDGAAPVLAVRVEAPPTLSLAAGVGYDSDRFGRGWLSLQRSVALGRSPGVAALTLTATGREQAAALEVRLHPVSLAPLVVSGGLAGRVLDVRFVLPGEDLEVTRLGGWVALESHRLLAERVGTLALRAERVGAAGEHGWAIGPHLRVSEPQSEPPVVGVPALLELEARWGDLRYWQARVRGSVGSRLGLFQAALVADAKAAFGAPPADVLPSLGEEWLVPGYRWDEGRGMARLVAGADAAHPVPGGGYLRLRLRAGAVDPRFEDLLDEARWTVGAELGPFYRTPFGVFSLSVGTSTRTEPRVVLNLGSDF